MPLVNAKCTNCGAALKINSEKDAAICEHCGAAFVVEKAINKFNIENVSVNVNKGTDAESLRILGCECLKNEDFEKAHKFFRELFMINHKDILAKYLYLLSENLIPPTEREQRILDNNDHPRNYELFNREHEKGQRADELIIQLVNYCLENDILSPKDDRGKDVFDFLLGYFSGKMNLYVLNNILEALMSNKDKNIVVDEYAHKFAKLTIKQYANSAELRQLVPVIPLSNNADIQKAVKGQMEPYEAAKKIADSFDDINIPPGLFKSEKEIEDFFTKKYQQNVKETKEIEERVAQRYKEQNSGCSVETFGGFMILIIVIWTIIKLIF